MKAAMIAADGVVFPIPISPVAASCTPRPSSSSNTSIPAWTASRAWRRDMAGPAVISWVPGATFLHTNRSRGAASAATPMSTTTTWAPTHRASTFIAAPPAAKFPTICPVTACG